MPPQREPFLTLSIIVYPHGTPHGAGVAVARTRNHDSIETNRRPTLSERRAACVGAPKRLTRSSKQNRSAGASRRTLRCTQAPKVPMPKTLRSGADRLIAQATQRIL